LICNYTDVENTVKISEALWGAKIINSILGNNTEGLTSVAMQQGGIGLLLSILIASVPPMAAMFFQGTLGSALTYSIFSGAGARPGPQGQPAGSWGGRSLANSDAPQLGAHQSQQTMHGNATRYAIPAAPSTQSEAVKDSSTQPNRLT
jgi:type IV secretion system protein VirB6